MIEVEMEQVGGERVEERDNDESGGMSFSWKDLKYEVEKTVPFWKRFLLFFFFFCS